MSVRRAALVLLLIVPLLLSAQQLAPQNDSIRKEDLKADLYFLAHDLTQGRLVGTPGNALAAEFIKSRFERLGLAPAGPDGSFFQTFNLEIAVDRRGQQPGGRRFGSGLDPPAAGTGLLSAAVQRQRARQGAGGLRRLRHHLAGALI